MSINCSYDAFFTPFIIVLNVYAVALRCKSDSVCFAFLSCSSFDNTSPLIKLIRVDAFSECVKGFHYVVHSLYIKAELHCNLVRQNFM